MKYYKNKLLFKFLLPVSILTFILYLLVSFFVYKNVYDHYKLNATNQLKSVVDDLVRDYDAGCNLRLEILEKAFDKLESDFLKYGKPRKANGSIYFGDLSGDDAFAVVEKITQNYSYPSTLFIKQGDDFIRVATTIQDSLKRYALNTILIKEQDPYKVLSKGNEYRGISTILGEHYLSIYKPLVDADSNLIGALFVGNKLERAYSHIQEIENDYLEIISFFVAMRGDEVFANSGSLAKEEIKEILNSAEFSKKWNHYKKKQNCAMNLTFVGAYSEQDLKVAITKEMMFLVYIGIISYLALMLIIYYVLKIYVINRLSDIRTVAEQIARGEIKTINIKVKSNDEISLLKNTINDLTHNIKNFIGDMSLLTYNIRNGNLNYKPDTSKYLGDFKDLVLSVNKALESALAPEKEAVKVLEMMAEGNFKMRVEGDYAGDHNILKQVINDTLDLLPFEEASEVLKEVAAGNLNARMEQAYKGQAEIFKLTLNSTVHNLRESRSRVQALFDAIPDIILHINSEGELISYKDNDKKWIVDSKNPYISTKIYDIFPENIANMLMENVNTVLQKNELQIYDYQILVNGEVKDFESRIVKINDKQAIIIIRDTTKQKSMIREIDKKDKLLESIALISKELLAADNFKLIVGDIFEILGRTADIDRIYIFESNGINDIFKMTYEWTSPGVSNTINDEEMQNLKFKEQFPKWFEELSRGNTVFSKVEEIKEDYRQIFTDQDIKSLLLMPIFSFGQLTGFLGFDCVKSHRNWKQSEISVLSVAAGTIGASIERFRREEAIKLNKQLLDTIIDNIPSLLYVKNAITNEFVIWNKMCKHFFRIDSKDVIGHIPEDVFDNEYAKVQKQIDSEMVSSDIYEVEITSDYYDRKSGKTRKLESVNVLIKDEYGENLYLLGIANDVTEYREAELAIRKSESNLKAIFDNTEQGFMLFDMEGNLELFNRKSSIFFEMYFEQKINTTDSIYDLFDNYSEKIIPLFKGSLKGDYSELVLQFDIDTTSYWFKFYFAPVIRNKNIVGVFINARDITRHILSEIEINQNLEFLETLIETIPSPFYYKDSTTMSYIGCNKAFEEFTGFTKNEILGRKVFDLYEKELAEEYNKSDNELLKSGGNQVFNSQVKDYKGEMRDVVFYKSCFKSKDGGVEAIVGIFLDISEQNRMIKSLEEYTRELESAKNKERQDAVYLKQLVTELEAAKQIADEANKSKSEFIANMSHEIRTPMNAVLGFTEILINKTNDNTHLKHLQTIQTSGKTLLSIINDILDISKIEAGVLELQYQTIDLNELIKDIFNVFEYKAQEKNIELNFTLQNGFGGIVVTDEVRIRQILFNLVGNAIKFTDRGEIKVTVEIENKAAKTADLIFYVKDTGIGIHRSQFDLIFEAFKQQSGQSNRKYGGTGLGLTVTKKLVEKMKGYIELESEVGVGSTFKVVLKDTTIKSSKIRIPSAKKIEYDYTFDSSTILLIDDNLPNRELVKEYLADFSFNIIEADDGDSAMNMIYNIVPELILIDLRVPKTDGYAIVNFINSSEELRKVPVVALTASFMSSDDDKIAKSFDFFLRKPISRKELIETFAKLLPHTKTEKQKNTKESPMIFESGETNITDSKIIVELIAELEGKYKNELERTKKILLISRVIKFYDELCELNQKYNSSLLIEFCEKLGQTIDESDILGIKEVLNCYEDIVLHLKEKL